MIAAEALHAFNNDGYTDVLWQNEASKHTALWYLKEANFASAVLLTNRLDDGWRIEATADFNRDGHSDWLVRSASTSSNELWLMKGPARIATQPLSSSSTDYQIAGAGDFDADGYPDILWRDPLRNQTVVWLMDGTNWNGRFEWVLPRPEFRWTLIGVTDFNSDGFADILWRDRYSGQLNLWIMNGTRRLRSLDIKPQTDPAFRLAAADRFNLIGNTDLLWQHANGQSTIWIMNGTNHVRTVSLPEDTTRNWRIAGTSGFSNRVMVSAIHLQPANRLMLLWRQSSGQRSVVQRRELGSKTWELLATNYLPTRLTNSDLAIGRRYEYLVNGEYLLAGAAAAPVEDRGRIILVVEETLLPDIEPDLELLTFDLVGDGWTVIRTNVPRHDDVVWERNLDAIGSIKTFITNQYQEDPSRTKTVLLVGHVPIPYSGFHNPDGHGGRALPSDMYYGDVDGVYTDSRFHYASFLGPPYFQRHANLIGDGKFDQIRVPTNSLGVAELELAVGRIDFSNLPSFGALSEAALTQRYIRKAHRYRHKLALLPQRVSAGTFFAIGPNRDAYAQATSIAYRLFGNEPGAVFEGDALDRNTPSLLGVLGANGLPFAVYGNHSWYHQSIEMAFTNREPRVAFLNVFASFCVDFHYPDNFLRAFTATPTFGLAALWFKPIPNDRIPLAFETLGLGEHLGTGFLRSIHASQHQTFANTYISLIGDPTLRLQVLAPPTAIHNVSDATAAIEWTRSSESNVTYIVYRSTNHLNGPWTRLTPNPITGTQYADAAAPPGPKLYQVRAAKLTHTGSGSYTNLSQGIFVEVD